MDNDNKEVIRQDSELVNKDKKAEKSGEETKPLKPRYALFAKHYVKSHNGSEACRLSGFKNKQPHCTANKLLNRPEIRNEIARLEKEQLDKIQITKPEFLLKVAEEYDRVKQESSRVRLLQLYGDILGYTKKEEATTTTNIFQSIEGAKTFLNGFKDTNADKTRKHTTEATIVQPEQSLRNIEDTTQVGGEKNNTPIANDVYTAYSGDTTILP